MSGSVATNISPYREKIKGPYVTAQFATNYKLYYYETLDPFSNFLNESYEKGYTLISHSCCIIPNHNTVVYNCVFAKF